MLSEEIKEILKQSNDIIYLNLFIGKNNSRPALLILVEGLINTSTVDEYILKPLFENNGLGELDDNALTEQILHGAVYHTSRKLKSKPEEIVGDILMGNAALIIGGMEQAVVFDVRGYEKRSISEPGSENVIKGPKDSFTETLRINTALIRRRLITPDLKIIETKIGTDIEATAAVVYLNGMAESAKVTEVLARIKSIGEKVIKSTSCVEDALSDDRFSLFPQVVFTERPDKLCANISEGKIAVLVDGYPVAFIVPAVFNMFFQSGEDYSQNYIHGSYIRVLRYFSAFLSLIIPGFYVGITTFHHEMIPTNLMLSIIKSKQSVSFTTFLEVFSLLIAFEILIETGIRLPKSIGQAVSIIGGLVVGEAAVVAKLISPAIVVIVAITGICGFIIASSDLGNAFRITRLLLLICAGQAGLYGLSLGLILMLYYMCTMSSLGEPYMKAYPNGKKAISDGLLRLPAGKTKTRAQSTAKKESD